MGAITRFTKRLWALTAPRVSAPQDGSIDESYAHFCEGCRKVVKITLWSMDVCPSCGSDQIKYIAAWMRTPGEQQAHVAQRRRFVKAINGGVPKPLPKPTIVPRDPSHAA